MNVLLTHGYFLTDDSKEQKIMRPYPPLGILYLSAWLDEKKIEHEVFDTTFSTKRQFYEYLRQHQPRVIGIYVNLMTKLNVLEAIRFVKENLPPSTLVLGGPEVKHHAQKFLEHGADYVVVGEGELTMAELCSVSDEALETKNVAAIHGLVYLKDNVLVETAEREKIKELDDLPIPNRDRINLQLYLDAWKNHHGTNALSVSTMRGCPYTCKWCSRAVYGLSYRRRSPGKVVDELAMIKETYRPDSVWFVDDVFTISHKWLTAFRDELKKRNVVVPYECITRADRMNEEVISLLKETGCFRVWIGAESGSQKIIDLMDRRVEVTQVRDMIRMTRQKGIQAGTFIMLGYPGETETAIEETIRHLKESNPDHFTITIAYPIKGTELYAEVENLQITPLAWSESTDRQIDFKRTYTRDYYNQAVKWVVNEVGFYQKRGLARWKSKAKAIVARTLMQVHKANR